MTSIWNDDKRLRRLLASAIALFAFGVNLGIKGSITLDWQHLYRPEDFHTWSDLWRFMSELQTGISPVWAFLEVSAQLILGSTAIFSFGLYPLSIGINAYLGTMVFSKTRLQVLISGGLSLVFAVAIRFIHKGNTEMYDMLMPALILGWLALLQQLRKGDAQNRRLFWLSFAAGAVLSLLELTRTLIFPLMPFFLVLSFLAMRPLPARYFFVFLLPLLLFSGSWHLKQVLCHDQLHWSNHDGFNMQKSWVDFIETPNERFEDDPPLYAGGFDNINTDRHTAYNKIVRKKVREAVLKQPLRATLHLGRRLLVLYQPKTVLFMAKTPSWFNFIYRPAVWFCGLSAVLIFFASFLRMLRAPLRGQSWRAFGRPEVALAIIILLISAVFAAGEVGEEARFLISLLPMLAAAGGVVVSSEFLLRMWKR